MENNFISITRVLRADVVCYEEIDDNQKDKYSHYKKISIHLGEGVAYIQHCDENKIITSGWSSREYYVACRIKDGLIELMEAKCGWVPSMVATRAYIDQNADKELLDG